MNCKGFVYIWYDIIEKLFYIGSHSGNLNDGYICSSRKLLLLYRLRPETFKRKILSFCNNKKDLLAKEQYWLNMIKHEELYYGRQRRYYNIKRSAKGGYCLENYDPITLKRLIKKRYGKKHSSAIKKAIKNRSKEAEVLHQKRRSITLHKTFSNPNYTNYQDKPFELYVNGNLFGIYRNQTQMNKLLHTKCNMNDPLFAKHKWIIINNRKTRKHNFKKGDILEIKYI